jgi:NADH dehydrogenase/NADH:ubiquinone oxidoreductase subunit G
LLLLLPLTFWYLKSATETLSTQLVLSVTALQTAEEIIQQVTEENAMAESNGGGNKPSLKETIEAAKNKLSKQDYKKVKSEYEQLLDHINKLDKYKANPLKYDNKGFLNNAPTEQIRQQIIEGRILKLEKEIQTFYDNIVKTLSTI